MTKQQPEVREFILKQKDAVEIEDDMVVIVRVLMNGKGECRIKYLVELGKDFIYDVLEQFVANHKAKEPPK